MNYKNSCLVLLALFACGLCSATVSGLGIANFTTAKGVVMSDASGSLTLLPPINQDNEGEIVLYVFTISNILDLTSSQILQEGEIVAQLVPTNTEIDNADYAGIITYSTDEDPNPLSDIEETTIDGVDVTEYKGGYTTTGTKQISSSLNADSLLGPMAGKSINDFEAALKAGNLTVVVRTVAYPSGELVGDIKSKELPPPAKAVAEDVSSSARLATMAGGMMAGLIALFV